MFDRYNIVSDVALRKALVKTAAYVAGLPTDPSVIRLQSGFGKNTDEDGQKGNFWLSTRTKVI